MRSGRAMAVRDAVLDAVVVLVAAGAGLGGSLGVPWFREPYDRTAFAVYVAGALALAFRRHIPLAVAWTVTASAAVLAAAALALPAAVPQTNLVAVFPPAAPFAIYSAIVFSRNRTLAWAAVGGLTAVELIVLITSSPGEGRSGEPALQALALVAGSVVLGLYVAARRRLLQALRERAERAEREQHLLAEQARSDERARLAAEIHDLVTHRVSLMVLQAGALRLTAADESTRGAAEDLRATGCQALEELRDLVGILRDSTGGGDDVEPADAERVPIPDLSSLVAESESVGTPVELVVEGDPTLVSPVVSRTAYRVVQEGLTNVRKHAPGAQARVYVRYGPAGVHLSVRNTAPTRAGDTALAAAGAGTGLLGLRQRVELINGGLRAGPDAVGGFAVEATLPAYVPIAAPRRGRDGRSDGS